MWKSSSPRSASWHCRCFYDGMKKILSLKLNAYLAVLNLLQGAKTTIASLPALQEAIDELAELVTEINLNVKIQGSPSGAADAKRDALKELGDLAYEVAGGVFAQADKDKDFNLAARVKLSRSGVTAGSANVIVGRCQVIIDAATEDLESLGDHGVTAEKLKALKLKLKTYDALRAVPRNAIGAAAAATTALERLFPQADRILNHQVEKLIWQFRATAPDLYDKYQSARSIVGVASSSTEASPAAPTNVVPAPSAVTNETPANKAA